MLRQKQGYQIEAMNADMTGEKALKLKQLAKAMQGDVQQSKMTIAQTKSANKIRSANRSRSRSRHSP